MAGETRCTRTAGLGRLCSFVDQTTINWEQCRSRVVLGTWEGTGITRSVVADVVVVHTMGCLRVDRVIWLSVVEWSPVICVMLHHKMVQPCA
jgi:hypothetical protein